MLQIEWRALTAYQDHHMPVIQIEWRALTSYQDDHTPRASSLHGWAPLEPKPKNKRTQITQLAVWRRGVDHSVG